MDTEGARQLATKLSGTHVGGWLVDSYIGNGKSAVVMRASREGMVGAIKVFDPVLVESYGRDKQKGRIERERALAGHTHPHLVQILDGGECHDTKHLFVVMEYLEGWPDLEKVLTHAPPPQIRLLISQIADAAMFLETRNLAHRDIKPSNIVVKTDFTEAKLLDLGVVRPIANSNLTDLSADRPFLATLRYSPPELLVREEEDNVDGWRAVTFYQLGGVLHDLIMRKPIFAHHTNPFPRLVDAIREEMPVIESNEAPSDLIILAKNCLIKDPQLRTKLVRWELFQAAPQQSSRLSDAKARILSKQVHAIAVRATPGSVEAENEARDIRRRLAEIENTLQHHVRHECVTSGSFPPVVLRDVQPCPGKCARFAVSFEPSDALGIRSHLTIAFQITLLDLVGPAVQLDAAAAASADDMSGWSAITPPFRPFAQGVFDPSYFCDAVDEVLYLALDMAMLPASTTMAPGPTWLTFPA